MIDLASITEPSTLSSIYWILIIFSICLLIALTLVLVWLGIPPGTFLIFISFLIVGLLTSFNRISISFLIIIFILFLIIELIEFLLSGIVSKKFGGNTKSSIASILGGIAGGLILGFFIPIIGGIIGVFAGSFGATYFTAKKTGMNHDEAMNASYGSMIGNMMSKWIKTTVIIFVGLFLFYKYWDWPL